ncbi:hypothetical protein AB4455_03315 [Vibrio sp. 10N.261.46.E12]|uniref:hypothetical protein n=1 Tax=unclassified Vibrio TaxID=2614977 RepID=UPI000975FB86|nr:MULTISPECIES: hypothetical protein [unclassified Vibrio]OMO32313.1 hypothetical protein BH584_16925 [Vibrio sp. 10N.261.45.E1]PMJ27671.1 hypothetical protein BCU27_06755 [Vibrio sp. 10N.286.45.B6]PML83137.1 hypothetical protein BCT66_19790 [Vibrio sp. 10N.261.49.E11]PMM69031.1 hypothetical protein BCT48_11370 [Vibrio sp. 10N.261.46.F12]PMM84708.1 hypothetical protein BCT46_10425 [Vibrio sp. 10N.261.46.E8]
MKKTALTLLIIATSGAAMAQNTSSMDQQKVNNDMLQLVDVQQEAALVMVEETSDYVTIDYIGQWVEVNNYVTHKEAKQRQLQKASKKYIYSQTGETLESIEQRVAEHIQADQPRYFSVDVYRNYHGDSGDFNYLARVIEYI